MKPEELSLLLERHLDGSLSEAEEKELTDTLAQHEWAQDQFVARMTLAADLKERLESDESAGINPIVPFSETPRLKWAAIGLAAAAALVFSLFLINTESTPAPMVRVIAAEGVGTLNIEALENQKSVKLRRGILELELGGESRVVIEAPSRFKVVDARLLQLKSGRCFAEMEKGKSGLRIETPSGEVLDLGTKFAVEVPSPKRMNVHVFDGMVEVSDGKAKTRLTEGQGIALADSGELSEVVANSALFVPRVPRALAEDTNYLHWSFDEGTGTSVNATGTDTELSLAEGNFASKSEDSKSPRWISGVVGPALEFDRQAWIATEHPGISGSQDRTVACWIKMPAEKQTEEVAPLVSWGLNKRKAFHKGWMLSVSRHFSKTPEIFGFLRLSTGRHHTYGTTNLRDGKWHHVAAVAMHGEHGAAMLLYVDGQLERVRRDLSEDLETATDHRDSVPVQFGRHLFLPNQLLRGSLDEVYIFGAALSGDEIRQLMHHPKPQL